MADTAIEILREEIKEFLKGADLLSASSKNVRAHLNDKFDCDFKSRKKEIDKVVLDVLTELAADEKKDSEDDDDDDDDDEDDDDDSGDDYSEEEKKSKKRKPPPRKAPARKPATKKSRAKASDSEDESDEPSDDDDSEDDRKKRRKRASNGTAKGRKSGGGGGGGGGAKGKPTGYLRKLKLSPELSEVMEEEFMTRSEVVKKMYVVVRERDLLDPKNRQFALLDEQLQGIFGQKRIRMFGMLKLLGKHFTAVA